MGEVSKNNPGTLVSSWYVDPALTGQYNSPRLHIYLQAVVF